MHRALSMAALILCIAACRTPIDFSDRAIPIDDTWTQATPDTEALQRYEQARAYAEAHRAVSMLVIEGTELVYAWQREDYDPSTPKHLFSGTKSFSCAVAELLVEDGLLDLDAPVADTIPELEAGPDVTARHLLHFTSGISQAFLGLTSDGMSEPQRVQDKYRHAVELPAAWTAGSRYAYGSSHQMVFGELVERLQGGPNALTLLEERVFAPIGLQIAGWHYDPSGNPMLPYGAWTTAHEWARYGVLIRDDGLWRGQRVLPEGVRQRCTTGSEPNPAYGITWWLNQPLGEDAEIHGIPLERTDEGILHPGGYADAFMAAGHNDQRMYVFPSEDLVVVLLSEGHRQFRDRSFVTTLLP